MILCTCARTHKYTRTNTLTHIHTRRLTVYSHAHLHWIYDMGANASRGFVPGEDLEGAVALSSLLLVFLPFSSPFPAPLLVPPLHSINRNQVEKEATLRGESFSEV